MCQVADVFTNSTVGVFTKRVSTSDCAACSVAQLWLTPKVWTVARQAPLSMAFSRQEDWGGSPCPPPGDLPDPWEGSNSHPLCLRHWQAGSLPLCHLETHCQYWVSYNLVSFTPVKSEKTFFQRKTIAFFVFNSYSSIYRAARMCKGMF